MLQKNQILAVATMLPLSLAFAKAAHPSGDQMFPAPNGHFTVRLHRGETIGNASYDRAEVLDRKQKDVSLALKGVGGDDTVSEGGFGWFDDPPVYWSRDSRYVAVACHDHREGSIDVVDCQDGLHACELPEITIPELEKAFESGRQWHTFFRPLRWEKDDSLIAEYSGTVRNYKKARQRPDEEAQLNYTYQVRIKFDASRTGQVMSVKRVQFQVDYVP